jgi:alkylation response protein AidB-like acyl-CoA dehydrogenase
VDLRFSAEEEAFAAEVRRWLADHLVPPPPFASLDDEVAWGRQWQATLAADRWVGIHWPEAYGGRGAPPVHVAIFNAEYARARAPQLVNRVGINLAGPTVLVHGTDDQKARWLAPILRADEIWCQLFSEPDAGSDLASLRTTATPVGGGWELDGQKVWTSYARFARWGICLARTDPDAPRHRGLSYLVVDMEAPGIEVRPLVQLTGAAEFNEVFLSGVFVPADHLVGELHGGWTVANTTLAHERGTSFPFKEQVVHETYLQDLYDQARGLGALDDPLVAADLAQAYAELRVLRLHNWRTLSRLNRGQDPGPESSWVKLAWTTMTQHLSATALDVLGAAAPVESPWSRQWLWSGAASIAGGTSEIQRTIIGERILGLPRERSPAGRASASEPDGDGVRGRSPRA